MKLKTLSRTLGLIALLAFIFGVVSSLRSGVSLVDSWSTVDLLLYLLSTIFKNLFFLGMAVFFWVFSNKVKES